MSEQKKGVHHAIKLSHYSVSKDEYLDIEDMAQEHLVNMLYKLVKDANYLANFKIKVSTGDGDYVTDDATLEFTGMSPNFTV
ncbi:uncharacterized protein METZ01_LOCUS428136 [marine metagenome]|uniref:Uncharacterized protein n=1 Tax=marine metagenome TaxID=408172 RepID=A0A382XW02_9ZZZZ|tara:strand:- start:33 stop:278 length:246 start_codon:yes stop_codon:yes gene_type:complete